MKKENKYIKGFLVGTFVSVVSLAAIYQVSAMNGKKENNQVKKALEENDYGAFKKALTDSCQKRVDNMTEEKFQKMRERYMNRKKVMEAIEKGDYEAFKNAVAGSLLEGKVSEEAFQKIVELHKARVEGNTEKVRELIEEIKEKYDIDGIGMIIGRRKPWKRGLGLGLEKKN